MSRWQEVVDRAELSDMYDRDITDSEWDNIVEALDDAIAGTLAEFL